MKRVTREDVQRVAANYIVPDHATVGWFIPATQEPKRPQKAAGAGGSVETSAASSPAGKESADRASFAQRTLHRVLPNGITLDVLPNHAVPTVAVSGIVLAGRMHQPLGKPAVPELCSMMLQRGTTAHDKRAIAARLDGVGANLSISNDTYGATIAGSSLARDAKLLLSTLAEEMKSPSFPDSELKKAKAEMKSEILQGYDSTRQRAFERLTQASFPASHPYHAPTKDEMLASLEAARVADLRAFHKDRWVGSGVYLAVVGDVDPEAVLAQVQELFGGLPQGVRPAMDLPRDQRGSGVHEAVALKGKANMDLMFGQASGLRRKDPDYEACLVANAALGQSSLSSRLGKRVRDTEGLTYSIYSRFTMTDFLDGVWLADVAVAPQNLGKALKSTREVIEDYCKSGITEEEVETQKSFFAGNYQVQLATNAGIAGALTTAEKYGYGPSYLDEFPGRVRAVTREQVNAAIKAHLDPAKMSIIVAGDLDKFPE